MSAVLVVPALDAGRWLTRMTAYAAEHHIVIGAVVTVTDAATAVHDLLAVLGSGEVSSILCALSEHVPAGLVEVAADFPTDRPVQRRPRPVAR